jgi:type I restriction-modification system DNA methylase subunit
MITQQDITKLKKIFATKVEMNRRFDEVDKRFKQVDQRFDEMKKDSDEQRDALAQTFTDVIKRLQAIENGQTKILNLLISHQQRLTTLESKILLS